MYTRFEYTYTFPLQYNVIALILAETASCQQSRTSLQKEQGPESSHNRFGLLDMENVSFQSHWRVFIIISFREV